MKLWSYPNPYKADSKELCDLLAVFGDYVFIFFDRYSSQLTKVLDKDFQVRWNRWKSKVVDDQIKTAHGAERYILNENPIFLDAKGTTPFPLVIDPQKAVVHKIIVAHGAKEACEQDSEQNIYGSLAISYCEGDAGLGLTHPFYINIDKRNPVHIFDSHNLPIVLGELDTVSDFSDYLDEKLRAVVKFDVLIYCGEEDLLGHYLLNYDKEKKRHIIGPQRDDINWVWIGEGVWKDFTKTDLYKNTKNENNVSYLWDKLIQRTCQNALDGTLGGNSDLLRDESAIFEMVKEPRFIRRMLMNKFRGSIFNFPDYPSQLARMVTFLPSYRPESGYVFLQFWGPDAIRSAPNYHDKRRKLLEIACGAARNKFAHLTKVIGIGMDAPKFAGSINSEDFILLPCETWTDKNRAYYEEQNREHNFFRTSQLKEYNDCITRFVPPSKCKG